jgi:hypothetical protein
MTGDINGQVSIYYLFHTMKALTDMNDGPPWARCVDQPSIRLVRKQPGDLQSGCDACFSGIEVEFGGIVTLIFDASAQSAETWLREEYLSTPVVCFQDKLFAMDGSFGICVLLSRI